MSALQVDPALAGGLSERVDTYPSRRIAGFAVCPGRPLPFGATPVPGGVNFSVYSNHATSMTLVLLRRGADTPLAELPFPPEYRIGGVYAMTVFGIDPEQIEYGYRAHGPFQPGDGHRFDSATVLADPYATLMTGREAWGADRQPDEWYRHRSAVAPRDFDWDGDCPLRLPPEDMVIYELHVRGFTRHSSSQVAAPGTYAGLVEKIPYLQQLGVNCVELMPIFEFDECDNTNADPATGAPLRNYWGYSPLGFFAPKASYAATGRFGMQLDEFKNLVKHLHRAGIEVVLDVVFNHTAEGNEQGPTLSFRGLDNGTYYMLSPEGYYYNFSGTGNTLNCNHPVVRAFVLDCLRYWAAECHVDGFRFDLAAILGRAPDGSLLTNPPLLESLANDPLLRDCKLIAEAWDAAGLYQVGSFPDYRRWAEWNGRYRDTVRAFLKGDPGVAGELATRLVGSTDLYGRRGPTASVNFITAHDGFTLHDLVSYNDKHNEANGESNRDGDNNNLSWNCGAEGDTDDAEVLGLRARQVRNALLLLLSSHGIPMLLAGDEAGRTQRGNNNAYCQDNELSWFDWELLHPNADLVRFTRCAIAFRRAHPCLRRARYAVGDSGNGGFPEVSWHGVRAWSPDWGTDSRLVAALFHDEGGAGRTSDYVYIAANAYWEGLRVELPRPGHDARWHLFADTSPSWQDGAGSGGTIHEPGTEPVLAEQQWAFVGPRSVLVLVARQEQE